MTTGRVRDEQWLADMFDAHAADVHRFVRRRLNGQWDPRNDADDVTAEVFAITWRRRHEVDEPILAWLYGVARRVLAGHRRRVVALPVEGSASEGLADDTQEVSDTADLVTEDMTLKQAWMTLSERDREVLLLAAWEGLTEAQIAVVLGVSAGGASAALSRARSRLRTALQD